MDIPFQQVEKLPTSLNCLGWWSFPFPAARIQSVSTGGTLYYREVPVGMPRIPDQILDCIFYLYPSVDAAKNGKEFGGSGFFFGLPVGNDRWVIYAITNWHVAVRDGASVMRINRKDGKSDIFEIDPAEWVFKPKWYDLATIPVRLNQEQHDFSFLPLDFLATPAEVENRSIGAGDDICMVGRFVDHDGGARNVPATRFGNISVMPQAIQQPTGVFLPSYVLDMHSRTGYSGSPVFVFRTPGGDFTDNAITIGGPKSRFVLLLGVHWGQFPELWEIRSDASPPSDSAPLTGNERYVEGMSGMTLAIPASAIIELLDEPKLKTLREEIMEQVKKTTAPPPKAESSEEKEPSKGK